MPPACARRVFAVLLLFLVAAASAFAQEKAAVPRATPSRPIVLVPLYASFGALQLADAVTTVRALDRGGVEANPVLGRLADNRGALVAVKAASTAGIIFASEKLWRRNRLAAVALMAGLNGAYALVVLHNQGRAW